MKPVDLVPVVAALRGALLFAVLSLAPAYAQCWEQRPPITTAASDASSVYATDLDGDGDADVLSASLNDDKIAWYENLGGGTFGPQQVITTAAGVAYSVYAADLDGDGDADVLSASLNDDKIAWYENLGGGTFGPQQVITTAADGATSVYAKDLDGDGDADVLSASFFDDKIAWYENLGGGTFDAQVTISVSAEGAFSVYATDLDGDGDADVLSASRGDDKIAWYENLGGGMFGAPVFNQQVITTAADGAQSVYAVDLDGDGDADVLSASVNDNKIAWYENLGGGTFGPQQVITQVIIPAADMATSVYAKDLDGDGDADVLSASFNDDKIAWYENLSGGTFGPQQVITTAADGAYSVYAADLDGDGEVDVLSASFDDKIAWYKNIPGTFGSCDEVGARYCSPPFPNSTGFPGRLLVFGSPVRAVNDVGLAAVNLPPNAFGFFITSRSQNYVFPIVNSQGALCIGGEIGRYVGSGEIMSSGSIGAISLQIELSAMPSPTGFTSAASGQTWNFQAWHRDANPTLTSNFTDAVAVTFQ